MTIHFVYVKGDLISTPFAITNEVTKRLSRDHNVEVYDWLERRRIEPEAGDILLGHAYPARGTIFWESFHDPRFSKRILLQPYAHGIPRQMAFLDRFVTDCDVFLAICGKYWIDTNHTSWFAHWKPKMIQVDLAINRDHFPSLKSRFNPPGARRFLNIGRVSWYKGTDYLVEIANDNPELEIARIGPDSLPPSRVKELGPYDFSTPEAKEVLSRYDFLLATGRSDANPTTILEAASWGLGIVATPQSGYIDTPWVTNFPLDDLPRTKAILHHLTHAPEEELKNGQTLAREALENHFHWDRFVEQIREAIHAPTRNTPEYRQLLLAEKVRETRSMLDRVARIELAKDDANRALHRIRLLGSKVKKGAKNLFGLGTPPSE